MRRTSWLTPRRILPPSASSSENPPMRSLLAALILAPATAFAGAYAIPNENARDLALSQSNVAAQNGPEAALSNPAALAGRKGLAVAASVGSLADQAKWSDPTPGSASPRRHAHIRPEPAVTYGVAGEFHAPEGIPLTNAIDYKHQAPLELTGRAHFDNIPGSLTAQLHDQNATEHVTAPNILYIGAAYELVPNLKVMGSWNL